MARTAKPRTTPKTPDFRSSTPGPDQFERALREAATLADMLQLNLGTPHTDETRALSARGVPIIDRDGEAHLYGATSSAYAGEFLRLQAVVTEVLTPEVLRDYDTRRDLKRARASAEYLKRAAEQLIHTVDTLPPHALAALDTNRDFVRVAGLWIDAARAIARRAQPETEEA